MMKFSDVLMVVFEIETNLDCFYSSYRIFYNSIVLFSGLTLVELRWFITVCSLNTFKGTFKWLRMV